MCENQSWSTAETRGAAEHVPRQSQVHATSVVQRARARAEHGSDDGARADTDHVIKELTNAPSRQPL